MMVWSQLSLCLAKWPLEILGYWSVKASNFLGVSCGPGNVV